MTGWRKRVISKRETRRDRRDKTQTHRRKPETIQRDTRLSKEVDQTKAGKVKYFDAMVTPVACFGAAHRKVYDGYGVSPVTIRSIFGPPGDVDWTLPWHEIPHHWNDRAKLLTARHGLKRWSVVCFGQ